MSERFRNMNYEQQLKEIEIKLKKLNIEVGSVQGQCELIDKQIKTHELNCKTFLHKKEIYTKAIELMNIVQKVTKDKVKEGFENIVSYALRYIYDEEYTFELDFGRRGNLQEINFNVKTPHCKEAIDPLDSSGGGVLDILSLALRIALLELSTPKIEGFVVLDEPFKHLSVEYLENARKFLEAINKRIGRQIIMITHKKELVENAEHSVEVK